VRSFVTGIQRRPHANHATASRRACEWLVRTLASEALVSPAASSIFAPWARGCPNLAEMDQSQQLPPTSELPESAHELVAERYRYILQQVHTLNEYSYKFLALYQTITTALVAAGIALFVGYNKWGITPHVAHVGIIGLLILYTIVAAFVAMLLIAGVASWWDYRSEECDLTDIFINQGFRERPNVRHFYRWYETYFVVAIIIISIVLWALAYTTILPAID
jgi:hypothetical protein